MTKTSNPLLKRDDFRKELRQTLTEGIVDIVFHKENGATRRMSCTLSPNILPPKTTSKEGPRKTNPDICRVWDTDKEEWRSFYFESVLFINGFSPGDYFLDRE